MAGLDRGLPSEKLNGRGPLCLELDGTVMGGASDTHRSGPDQTSLWHPPLSTKGARFDIPLSRFRTKQ